MIVTLAALPAEEIERDLARHRPEWVGQTAGAGSFVLSNGAVGAARSFDLAGYTTARTQALTILNTALRGADHSELFKVTEPIVPEPKDATRSKSCCARSTPCLARPGLSHSGTPVTGSQH